MRASRSRASKNVAPLASRQASLICSTPRMSAALVARGLGRQAGGAQPLDFAVEIVLELFAQVGFTPGAEEERSEVIAQDMQNAHAASVRNLRDP